MTADFSRGNGWHRAKAPATILLIVTRRIGDVLLATPLIRSIRQAWPQTKVDVLVFSGTEGVLAANTDVNAVHTVPERPGILDHARLAQRLWRRYDMAVSLLPGDRPTIYAWIAGRSRIGLLADAAAQRWKKWLLDRWATFDDRDTHTVRTHLALAGKMGITPAAKVTAAWTAADEAQVKALLAAKDGPLAVLHAYPKFNYKMWQREGWIELGRWLDGQGFRIVLSGGGDAAERAYVTALAEAMPAGTINAAGALTLGASACLVSQARVYIGTDTAMTHVAAASGVPTVALFGPTNPVKWGPWPHDHPVDTNPWRRKGSQSAGNVALVQGEGPCVPCMQEGCERRVDSFSDCLTALPARSVITAVQALLAAPAGSAQISPARD